MLFRAGIDPHRPGRLVTRDEWDALWADLVTLMRAGVCGPAGSSPPGPPDRDRGSGRRAPRGRALRLPAHRPALPGLRDAGARTEVMAARNLFWCPRCQAT